MDCFPSVRAPFQLAIFTSTCSAVISIIAIIGNVIICVAVYKDPFKNLRSPFTYFLVNLAAADLIVGIIYQPISVYFHAVESQGDTSDTLTKVLHMSYFISGTASILSLLALCMDRYLAIKFAIKYRSYLTWTRCFQISCIIWLASFTLPFTYLKLGYIDNLMVHSHTSVIVALVGLIVTYINLYLFLRKQATEMANIQRTTSTAAEEMRLQRLKLEKKITRTFLWILILFIATYVPSIIMVYILHFCESCHCTLRHVLRDLQFLLISSNSCMNPFVCTIRLKQFRKSVYAILPRCCQHSNDEKTKVKVELSSTSSSEKLQVTNSTNDNG